MSHFQNSAWLIENRLPYTAWDVRLEFASGTSLSGVEGDLTRVLPAQPVKVLVFRSLGGGDLFEVSWKRRRGSERRHRATVALHRRPPAPAAAPQTARHGERVY